MYKIIKFTFVNENETLEKVIFARRKDTAIKIIEEENTYSSIYWKPRKRCFRKIVYIESNPEKLEKEQLSKAIERRIIRARKSISDIHYKMKISNLLYLVRPVLSKENASFLRNYLKELGYKEITFSPGLPHFDIYYIDFKNKYFTRGIVGVAVFNNPKKMSYDEALEKIDIFTKIKNAFKYVHRCVYKNKKICHNEVKCYNLSIIN